MRKQIKKCFFLHFFQSHKITLWQITPIKVILSSDYHSRKSLWRLGWSPSRVMCGDHPVGLRDFWWSVTIPESLYCAIRKLGHTPYMIHKPLNFRLFMVELRNVVLYIMLYRNIKYKRLMHSNINWEWERKMIIKAKIDWFWMGKRRYKQ